MIDFITVSALYCDIIIISNYHCSTDGLSKTLILHDIYTDGQSCRLEALFSPVTLAIVSFQNSEMLGARLKSTGPTS